MAVTHTLFGLGVEKIQEQSIDWINDDIRVALCTSAYTPLQDTHDFFDDVTNEVIGSTGYTTGGFPLVSQTITYDAASNEVRFDAGDPLWSTSTITARIAVVYKYNATASAAALIGWIDFDGDEVSSAGDFTIAFATNSVFKINVT
jgi:hypothetical protein